MEKKDEKKSYITIIFVILNIIAYILYTILGEIVYNMGSLSIVDIIERQEYYRIISCTFLHAGVEHILGNMVFLAVLGDMLEKEIGHISFGMIYLLSGVGGSLFSMGYELLTGQFYHTVGASGAVCGILGALLILVIVHHGNFATISLPRMLLAIAYLIYSGLQSSVVNNAAHIGGLFVGIVLMLCLVIVKGFRQVV